ncbi:TPA: GTPase Era [Candidatus Galligastranaerophilus intestinavium]|uniref:GTPase Era n=1 Tax=Candidatus Galligastranaerophilus intestinavium TaxID=2840836 RepID=A0A9D1FJZ4_9BACT|nr:GTPase Era [Candidatus Galligastranaerophilus intestinavium]
MEENKVGFVAIIARPNVGKSTLLNRLIGQKIAITTPVAQTTRKNIKGIYSDNDSQIIFIDTPGIHKPLNKLGEALSEQSKSVLGDVDLILFLVDAKDEAGRGDKWIVENYLKDVKTPVLLVLNKVDLIKDLAKRELNTYSYKSLFEKPLDTVKVSAKTGRNIDDLIEKIKSYLPFGQKLYDEDEVTDQNMREITSEIIREKIIFATKDEIPHSVAVLIENYTEEENIDKISAQIIVSNESQKKILIGKGGSMIKKIGTNARVELEKITEKKVFLELFVKVVKNWQKDDNFIKSLGLEVK